MKSRKLVIFIVVICVVLAVISLLSNRQPDDIDISSEAGSVTESMVSVPSEDSALVSSEQSGSVEGQGAVNSQVPVESQVPAESVTSSENTPPLEETVTLDLTLNSTRHTRTFSPFIVHRWFFPSRPP